MFSHFYLKTLAVLHLSVVVCKVLYLLKLNGESELIVIREEKKNRFYNIKLSHVLPYHFSFAGLIIAQSMHWVVYKRFK